MTIQVMAGTPAFPQVTVITTTGGGSITSPRGATRVTVEAIGAGGTGFGSATNAQKAGGGGGQYAATSLLAITGGTTVIFYSVGLTNGTGSWVNISANAQPATTAAGCFAPGGTTAASATAGVGNQAGVIGTTTLFGGNGSTGVNARGGGGSGASTAGSNGGGGGVAGTDTTGLSIAAQQMAGGTGGAVTAAGTAPGGGGGGGGAGVNPGAGQGQVRITFYG